MKKSIVLSVACAVLALCGIAAETRKVAVFAQNASGEETLDGLVSDAREQLADAFAEAEGFKVVKAKLEADDLKIPTNAVRKAGADFVVVTTFVKADSSQSADGGVVNNNFTLTLSLKVLDAKGEEAEGIPSWTGDLSFVGAGPTPEESFRQILENWKAEIDVLVATKAANWPTYATAKASAKKGDAK